MNLRLVPLTREHALDISTWRYKAPYDIYDQTDSDPDEMVTCGYFGVLDGDTLIAFRSFGADGQVPGWDYDDSALDTGGGLRPSLVGQGRGLGRAVIAAGLEHGRALFRPPAFRVTVASFNARALRTVESLGFVRTARFDAARDGRSFEVLVRPEQ